MSEHWMVVDFSNLAMRGYHSTPAHDPNRLALVPEKVHGMLDRLIREWSVTHLLVGMDSVVPNFRYALFPDYKGTRDRTVQNTPARVCAYMREYLEKWNVVTIEADTFEADDVLASAAYLLQQQDAHIISLVSRDMDILQVVSDRLHTRVLWPEFKGGTHEEIATTEWVHKRFGVYPHQIPDFKALVGDDSDHLPRVGMARTVAGGKERIYGFRAPRAIQLLAKYSTLENLYACRNELSVEERVWLTACKEQAFLVQNIATLRKQCLTTLPDPEQCAVRNITMSSGRPRLRIGGPAR